MEQAQTQALSDKQREAFARLIADAKKHAQAQLEDDDDAQGTRDEDRGKDRDAGDEPGLLKELAPLERASEQESKSFKCCGIETADRPHGLAELVRAT